MESRLRAIEVGCAKKLAELFEKNVTHLNSSNEGALGLTPENRNAVLATMEQIGIISDVANTSGRPFSAFRITAKALQVARAIQEQETAKKNERRDIVAEVRNTAKSNTFLAWLIIGFIVLTAIVTFTNQLWQLLERFAKK